MSRHGRTLLAGEVGLWLVSVAAIVGMHRLFEDGSYRPALLLQATAAHLVVALLRRRGIGLVTAGGVTAAAGVLMLTWAFYARTTTWLLPGGATWRAVGDDLGAAWRLFQHVDAPAPVETGFLIVAGAAVWVMVYVADWAAFRAAATFEALLPSATLFLFAAALGAPGGRLAGATLYAATAMLFVLLQRTLNQEQSSAWAASHRMRGRWSLLGTGAALIAVAVIAGAVAGPNLPGASADAIIAWQDLDEEDETRVVVSPMVDLNTRLVEQPDVEVFTVRTTEPQGLYWRLTALDRFDGEIWRSSYGTNDADGSLPQEFESTVPADTVRQTFSVANLAAVWLPAAYEPATIDAGDSEVEWDAESSTLLVDRSLETSDGFTYEVESRVPRWTAEQMRTATADVPGDVAERYLQLPEVNERVATLARNLTDGMASPYDKALELMDYLRGPNFTYDLTVRGHSTDALTSFLFDTRRGYCEQFAGAYAVMARLIGLPSRVIVGFTPGIRDPEDPTLWQVRGEHAHAWAEVYLGELGWVMVDPTPGRAPPGAEEWLGTGITPQQDTATGNTGVGTRGAVGAPAGQVPGAPTGGPSGDAQRAGVASERDPDEPRSNAGDQGAEISTTMRRALLVIALAALAYLVLVPTAVAGQRALRRRRALAPADRVRLAWRETLDRGAAGGVDLPPSLTLTEAAERLTAAVPGAAAAVRHLAGTIEHVMYAEVPPSPEQAEQALAARDAIADELRQRETLATRVARYLDARELWRGQARRARRLARNRPAPALGA